jgi:hypothetical protein
MPVSEPQPSLFLTPPTTQQTMVPEPRFLKVKCPFLNNQASNWTAEWHHSTGVFIARTKIPYLAVLGVRGAPAEIDGNTQIRRQRIVGRRRRGHHLTGGFIARLLYLIRRHLTLCSLYLFIFHTPMAGEFSSSSRTLPSLSSSCLHNGLFGQSRC